MFLSEPFDSLRSLMIFDPDSHDWMDYHDNFTAKVNHYFMLNLSGSDYHGNPRNHVNPGSDKKASTSPTFML